MRRDYLLRNFNKSTRVCYSIAVSKEFGTDKVTSEPNIGFSFPFSGFSSPECKVKSASIGEKGKTNVGISEHRLFVVLLLAVF